MIVPPMPPMRAIPTVYNLGHEFELHDLATGAQLKEGGDVATGPTFASVRTLQSLTE